MDRIPTTNEGALGGGWDTAASPMAGVPPGRFGERRVSIATRTPPPLPGRGDGTGSGVAAVERPGVIRYARLAGATLDSAATTPGSASGASAAGDARERWESLPEPRPTPGYRRFWEPFVRWCENRNLQYWPARPETVADYLRFRAHRCSMGSLNTIRSAISNTHRTGGFGERFKGGVVAATFEELASAKGETRAQGKNISGLSLNVAEFEKIRKAAFEPRAHGRGFESREVAARRGRVDLALCSLVLEAGLGCEQAAALEWRDLAVDANERPTIAIRPGSGGAGVVVNISNRAHDDLRTIAPKNAEARKWIFGLNAKQFRIRIRAVARAGGLESQIAPEVPRRRGHAATRAATTDLLASTVRARAGYWQEFCAWCDKNEKKSLPARAETVAAYLREGSEERTLGAINNRLYVIRDEHHRADCEDPCESPIVKAAMRDIRGTGGGFTPSSLNPDSVEAIRAVAVLPRRTRGRRESDEAARKRGLVDIALCSVLYAAGLTLEQAVSLKWRDVEQLGEDKARLTVKSGVDSLCSAEDRVIAAQAFRDLVAIRGEAWPGDSVFGLTSSVAYKRMKEVARRAGLAVRHEPSTAGPSRSATTDPSQSATTDPSRSATAGPSQPVTEGPPPPSQRTGSPGLQVCEFSDVPDVQNHRLTPSRSERSGRLP